MTLENYTVEQRCKITKDWPVLLSAFPKSGKSAAIEFLSEEDKARTIVYDLEGKGLPEDDGTEYRSIIRLKPTDAKAGDPLYVDRDNVKFRTISEIMAHMRKAIAHKDVDRVIIDTFTALVGAFERHYVKLHNGYTVWTEYNRELADWFQMVKEETYTHGKFVYLLGHYVPSKPVKNEKGKVVMDTDAERFTTVKGKDSYRMVESHFNTVITIEDFKLMADNTDDFSSTRIRRSLSPYESKENSLAELEEALGRWPKEKSE